MTAAKPYLIHADRDKPHRCPACWRVAVHDGPLVPWRIYTCCECGGADCTGCGQRFADRPWLPCLDDEPGRPFRYSLRAARECMSMMGHRWRIWGAGAAFSAMARYPRDSARAAWQHFRREQPQPATVPPRSLAWLREECERAGITAESPLTLDPEGEQIAREEKWTES